VWGEGGKSWVQILLRILLDEDPPRWLVYAALLLLYCCFTAALLSCFTASLLHCCFTLLLYCFAAA
jgi:hypothetical protein